jgi:hypothetical protein
VIARQLEAHVAQSAREKAAIRKCLETITDEAATACGKLAKQVSELQAQLADQKTAIEEMRGQLTMLRALQPQKLLRKGAAPPTIEGSLNAPANLN